MADLWIVNASPLITLAKIGRLELLAAPDRSVIVPQAVAAALQRYLGEAWEP